MTARTNEKWQLWRRFAGAGAVLASALGAAACAPPAEAPAARPPAIQLADVTLRHYPSEGPPRIAHAAEVTFNRESAELSAQAITADVPPTGDLARGGVHLEAEAGKGDVHGVRAEVLGKLQVTTGEGDRGETVGSVWDSETGFVVGEEPLRVNGPGYSVAAKSYRFHVRDQQLQLEGGVHVVSDAKPGHGAPKGEQR